jgi:hypothetical protein
MRHGAVARLRPVHHHGRTPYRLEGLGTFGRTFRDVTGHSPGALRARDRATAQEFGHIICCVIGAATKEPMARYATQTRVFVTLRATAGR